MESRSWQVRALTPCRISSQAESAELLGVGWGVPGRKSLCHSMGKENSHGFPLQNHFPLSLHSSFNLTKLQLRSILNCEGKSKVCTKRFVKIWDGQHKPRSRGSGKSAQTSPNCKPGTEARLQPTRCAIHSLVLHPNGQCAVWVYCLDT